jgi:hypothetical protein
MKKFIVFVSLFTVHCSLFTVNAQSSLRDSSVNGFLIGFSYGYQIPFGELADRFGNNGLVGAEVNYKLRNNFTFGVDGGYMFGRTVNEYGFLDSIATPDGYFVGYTGLFGGVALFERGYSIGGTIGKIFPAFGSNPNSGIYTRLGIGFMQHKIKITDTENSLYQFLGDYIKGYDRLTNGLMLSQYVGYENIDPKHLLNFHVGFYFQEGFTKNRRSWNYDERRQDTRDRFDFLIGVRGTWMLPFFSKREQRFYTN